MKLALMLGMNWLDLLILPLTYCGVVQVQKWCPTSTSSTRKSCPQGREFWSISAMHSGEEVLNLTWTAQES